MLLIEDDASIRRFVELALDDQPVALFQADCLQEARQLIRGEGPFRLLITDLMLPDGSGETLLQELLADPALRGGARLAVFSAGVSAERRELLRALGADEVIAKPASLAQLLGCVERALSAPAATSDVVAPAVEDDSRQGVDAAVEAYFAGDRALYDSYRSSCLEQFPRDRLAGESALRSGDAAALRRLAHSLKTVLQTLGHASESVWARQLEADASEGRLDTLAAGWARLDAALRRLGTP